jgi:hypothetical protein
MKGKMLCLSAALALAGAAAFAADGKADARVAKQLDKLGLQYTTTSSGNYSIEKDIKGDRKQTVFIMSKTETYGGLEIREIWSNAGSFDTEVPADTMLELLNDNNTEKIGAWSVEQSDDGGYLVFFSLKVPVYLRDKDLSDMLDFASTVADEMELKLFNVDDN